MKLRLLVRPDCNRACPGCCNKQWDLTDLPICDSFTGYDEIMLTGGEPMMDYAKVIRITQDIRKQDPTVPIFMYTAKTTPVNELGIALFNLSGVTVTLHKQSDVEPFLKFNEYVKTWKLHKKRTLRLNIFKPIVLPAEADISHWITKPDMEWILNCPLPADEVFERLPFEEPLCHITAATTKTEANKICETLGTSWTGMLS